jgi:hypothetical protein
VLTTPRMQPHSAGHAGASRAGHLSGPCLLGAERPGGAAQRLVSCRSSDSTRSASIGASVTLSAACFLDCCSRFACVTNVEVIAAVMIARNADALGHHDGADELAGDGDDEGCRHDHGSRRCVQELARRNRRRGHDGRNCMIGLARDGAGLVLRSERALAGEAAPRRRARRSSASGSRSTSKSRSPTPRSPTPATAPGSPARDRKELPCQMYRRGTPSLTRLPL